MKTNETCSVGKYLHIMMMYQYQSNLQYSDMVQAMECVRELGTPPVYREGLILIYTKKTIFATPGERMLKCFLQ